MAVIVFNKRTGKYLRRHSGSFRHFKYWVMPYKYSKEAKERFGICPSHGEDEEGWNEYRRKANRMFEDKAFDAEPENSRIYASKSSATTSVGRYIRNKDGKRTRSGLAYGAYVLPDHLEIHEIKEAFVCVMRPDGSSNCDEED